MNARLTKEYSVPKDIFAEGYDAFQKKYIFPRRNIQITVYLILSAVWTAVSVYAGFEGKIQYMAYLLIVFFLAMAVKSWHNPLKQRESIMSAFEMIGDTVYNVEFYGESVEFSTISQGEVENPPPEKTVINFDENYSLLEYERFFLLFSGKELFYILPKEIFSESEIEIIRKTAK